MIPQFVVFVSTPPTNDETQCIKMLQDAGFIPLVDAVHGHNFDWFQITYRNNHRLFWLGDELSMFDAPCLDRDTMESWQPSFSVAYNENDFITMHDWTFLHRYFEHLFYPNCAKPKLMSRRVNQLLGRPLIMKSESTQNDMDMEEEQGYQFEKSEILDRNLCLCTVFKPHTDKPYTVVIKDFNQRGLRPFFTSLFVSDSWGVSKHDIQFLHKVWEEYMKGEFDLDKMLKEDTEACYPSDGKSPQAEPIVYRKTLLETLKTLQNQEEGRLFKSTC